MENPLLLPYVISSVDPRNIHIIDRPSLKASVSAGTFWNMGHLLEKENSGTVLYQSWFNNRMTLVFKAIHSEKPANSDVQEKILSFLDEVEQRSFQGNEERRIKAAFWFLRRFFRSYPRLSRRNKRLAFYMLGTLYQASDVPSESLFSLMQRRKAAA